MFIPSVSISHYQTCAFSNAQFYNRRHIRCSPTHALSPSISLCLSSILPSLPRFRSDIKRWFDRLKIINWINAFVKHTVLISKVTSIQNFLLQLSLICSCPTLNFTCHLSNNRQFFPFYHWIHSFQQTLLLFARVALQWYNDNSLVVCTINPCDHNLRS